jgi:hypothetical protein
MRFGPASANIRHDCVIRDQNEFNIRLKRGENRDAETEGFFID